MGAVEIAFILLTFPFEGNSSPVTAGTSQALIKAILPWDSRRLYDEGSFKSGL